jgi:hypothetical protein
MASPAAVTWSGIPLRAALASLSEQWHVAFFLDRRVDPDQLVTYNHAEQPLEDLVRDLAAKLGLSVSIVDSVVYLAPPEVAWRVSTQAEVLLDAAQQQRAASLLRRRPLEWPHLTEPRELVAAVIRDSGFACPDLEQIPHDLWAANRLPPLPVTHVLTLLLAGFDLTFHVDAAQRQIRFTALPDNVSLTREYPITGPAAAKRQLLAERFPQTRVEWLNNRVRVHGTADEHYGVRRLLAGQLPSQPRAVTGQLRYTLRTQNRFEPLARALGERLGLVVEIDPRVREIQNRLVTIDVRNATREQLLDALVDSVGWAYEISGNKLKLFPRPSP